LRRAAVRADGRLRRARHPYTWRNTRPVNESPQNATVHAHIVRWR
jgi:hypothetical protein